MYLLDWFPAFAGMSDEQNRKKVLSQPFKPKEDELFRTLWEAQAGKCALCGEDMPQNRFETAHSTLWKKLRPTFDHIKPRSKGGPDTPENLQLAHARCNKIKGNK